MSNSNSFGDDEVRTLPYWFRAGLPEPLTAGERTVSGAGPHCATCHCETPAQRQARRDRERQQREHEEREREFVRNHAVLTEEDVAWARAHLPGARR